MEHIIYLSVALIASTSGAICGMGGGVIIKPVLDALGLADVAVISFLSSCTVLSMSVSSIVKTRISRSAQITLPDALPLAMGAMAGGIIGKEVFQTIKTLFSDLSLLGAIQSLSLLALTTGCLFYVLNQDRIRTFRFENKLIQLLIGMALGIVSAFLGIGGGPINLVVLYLFFSVDTKKAAQLSMYIIFFSQTSSIVYTFIQGAVPELSLISLILMICGGLTGGTIGTIVHRQIDTRHIKKLFVCLMLIIIGINLLNFIRFVN